MVESKTHVQMLYMQLPFLIEYAYSWRKNAKATGGRTTWIMKRPRTTRWSWREEKVHRREEKKKQEGNKKSQAGKKNCEWKCMLYYPLILKIIIFPRITFINFFRNLTNTTEVSQHSCEQTTRGSELEHSYQPYAITRLVTANTVEKSLYGERNDSR